MSKINSYSRLNIIGSLVPIAAFVIVGTAAFIEIGNLVDDESWVTHTYTVIDKVGSLLATVVDAETGQRGYLITGNVTYLAPYNLAIADVGSQINDLRQLTSDNPVQQSNLDKLSALTKARLAQLENNVNLRKTDDISAVIQNIDGVDQGKQTMGNIRATITDMINEESRLLAERNAASKEAALSTELTIIIGTAAAVLVTVLSTLMVNKKLKNRQELEQANLELQVESKRLQEIDLAKEEFSSMVTHELKTPLTPIKGRSEMLLEPDTLGNLNDLQRQSVKIIYDNAVKLERLIGDVLDAQKLDMDRMKFNKEAIKVKDFLAEFEKDSSHLMNEKNIEFVNKTSIDSIIQGDSGRLTQVLSNLVRNSVDFVPPVNGRIEIGAVDKDNQVVFYVKDNGVGIPEEQHDNLFKKFFQVDTSFRRSHGGTGLGLVICKGIVEALGGRIWFESGAGKGTTFYFALPRLEGYVKK